MLVRGEKKNTIIKTTIEKQVDSTVITTVFSDKLRCIYESHIRQCTTSALKNP